MSGTVTFTAPCVRSRKADEYSTLTLGKVIAEPSEYVIGFGLLRSVFMSAAEALNPFWTKLGAVITRGNAQRKASVAKLTSEEVDPVEGGDSVEDCLGDGNGLEAFLEG